MTTPVTVRFKYADGTEQELTGLPNELRRGGEHKKDGLRPVRVDVTGEITSAGIDYLCGFYLAALAVPQREGVFLNGEQCLMRWNDQGTDFSVYTQERTL